MRIHRIKFRPNRSIVQQTAVANVRSVLSDIAKGNPVDFFTKGVPGSYDFDGVDVDWDSPKIVQAPNKIEQQLHPEKYLTGVKEMIESKPPVQDPSPTPSTQPAE